MLKFICYLVQYKSLLKFITPYMHVGTFYMLAEIYINVAEIYMLSAYPCLLKFINVLLQIHAC